MKYSHSNAISVLLADDHSVVRDGICMRLSREANIQVVGEASNGKRAVEQALHLCPDIVLMDISMPVMNGLEATEKLRAVNPNIKVLILTMHDNKEYVLSIMKSGAKGYVLKDVPEKEMIYGINRVHSGEDFYCASVLKLLTDTNKEIKYLSVHQPLSKREEVVLKLVAEGFCSKTIASKLFLSVRTVETHRHNIMKKLDVHSSAGLVRCALGHKIL